MNDKKWNGTGYDGEGNIIYKLNNGTGNVKEYNIVGCLIYEGGYLNGEKNGKGKEYNYFQERLKFEGEYLNGKRNGKGREYWNNGELKFECEYLNGKKKGQVKEYYNKDKIYYEKEYLKGERKGKGKE